MKRPIYWILLVGFLGVSVTSAQNRPQNAVQESQDVNVVFRVKWDGQVISGITEISELKRSTQVVDHRSGGDPSQMRHSPGLTTYEPIVLKRPKSSDTSFEQWANKTWSLGRGFGAEVSLKDYRKDIIIELCTDTGVVLMAYRVYRCWPSDYIALSKLKANDSDLAMETLILQHEGWERDLDVR